MTAMRVVMLTMLLCGAARADTRRVPDKLAKPAGDAFAKAVNAETRGDLEAAVRLYTVSIEIASHPNTWFNLAQVQAKLDDVIGAIASYEAYLALSPRAADRAAVEAAIEALARRTATLEIQPSGRCTVDLSTAYVIVDGVIVRKPGSDKPLEVPVGHGAHTVDIITAISYVTARVEVRAGKRQHLAVCPPTRVDGNVVVRVADDFSLVHSVKGLDRYGARMVVPPKGVRLRVLDGRFECAPFSVAPARGDAIAYVHVGPVELAGFDRDHGARGPERCRKVAVKRHTLTF